MTLAHWVIQDPKAHTSFDMVGDKVLLDNGAYDLGGKESIDNQSLLEATNILRPGLVFLPDKIGDANTTYTLTKKFLEEAHQLNDLPPQTGCVPILQDLSSEDGCLKEADRMKKLLPESVQRWGIPFKYRSSKPSERISLAKRLYQETGISSHFLGLSRNGNLNEFSEAGPEVSSLDTGYPITCALHGVTLSKDGTLPRLKAQLPFEGPSVIDTPGLNNRILHNVSIVKSFVEGF